MPDALSTRQLKRGCVPESGRVCMLPPIDSRSRENPRQGAMARRSGVNSQTGELVQIQMLPGFEEPPPPKKPPVSYSWRGRHVNVSKEMGAAVWRADSGFDQKDRDVLGFYLFNTKRGGPGVETRIEMTFDEIGDVLGMNPRAVSKSVRKLHQHGFLLEAGKIAKVVFYRLNARFAYDGGAEEQVKAVADMRHPVVPTGEAQPAASRPRRPRPAKVRPSKEVQ
nr:helix-turn-helix domain-containing protein [Streptomyces sp. 14R-10]